MIKLIYRLTFKGALGSDLKTVSLGGLREFLRTVEDLSDTQEVRLEQKSLEIHTDPETEETEEHS